MSSSAKLRIIAFFLILATIGLGFFVYKTEKNPNSAWKIRLGLDLKGGTELTYKADVSKVAPENVSASMSSLRDVIEARVNLFGVSEPVVQTETAGVVGGGGGAEQRLVVELPGITDVSQAVALIGKTPLLEFKTVNPHLGTTTASTTLDQAFVDTPLTGSLLQHADLQFDSTSHQAVVSITFNDQGKQLFADMTKNNIGKQIAIFLDGQPISIPTVREEIDNGQAQISGNFTPQAAQKLVQDLNYGSLPVPVELISTQTIGATLGDKVLHSGIYAALLGFLLVAIFLILWYRLPGLVAVVSLVSYVILILSLFKLFGVTMTAAGIAGFILSMGIAVDANVLIFERMKEELRHGRSLEDGIREGFTRAWNSIRDGNLSGLIASIILFWLGTSLVKGFALTLGMGILVSIFTATIVARTYLLAIAPKGTSKLSKFLFGSGVTK